MDEFDLIAECFAPLAKSAGADGLRDDVALLEPPAGRPVIVTTDAMVEGVHFLPGDPMDSVAKKLLRVNVSDIIAKGAAPFAASLALIWPKTRDKQQIYEFAKGLAEDLELWRVALIGGDTTSTPGPLTLSLTLHGACHGNGPVRRSGARPGDVVCVTGRIGAGWLGLEASLGRQAEKWMPFYREPRPPHLELAKLIALHANASLDVSDGLVADAGHIARQSNVQLRLETDLIPFANDQTWEDDVDTAMKMATGGDDYQTLFTCAPRSFEHFQSNESFSVTKIGEVAEGNRDVLLMSAGEVLPLSQTGWKHF